MLAALLAPKRVVHRAPPSASQMAIHLSASRLVVESAFPSYYQDEFQISRRPPTGRIRAHFSSLTHGAPASVVEDVDGIFDVNPHAAGGATPQLIREPTRPSLPHRLACCR